MHYIPEHGGVALLRLRSRGMQNGKSPPSLHRAAQQGFSASVAAYGRGRPDYPLQLLPWLRQTLGLGPGRTAVDLGAGTGKFTRLMLQSGVGVIAVEPIEAMRSQLLQNLAGVTVLAASAQSMPLADQSVDAVLCAQAFHWFAAPEALGEIARVLRPGGKLGLVWNVRDESVPWVAAISRIVTPHEGDTPRFHQGTWRQLFPSELFSGLQETAVENLHVGSVQDVIVDRVMSVSFIAASSPAVRAEVAAQLDALIAAEPQLNSKASVEFPYLTRAYWATRLPAR
jgi:SAM-dependent methyltransferase